MPNVSLNCQIQVQNRNIFSFEPRFTSSYTCTFYDTVHEKKLFFWNTTVSENCCVSCNMTVYKHNSVISSSELKDECQTTELSICRILPGIIFHTVTFWPFTSKLSLQRFKQGFSTVRVFLQEMLWWWTRWDRKFIRGKLYVFFIQIFKLKD